MDFHFEYILLMNVNVLKYYIVNLHLNDIYRNTNFYKHIIIFSDIKYVIGKFNNILEKINKYI